MLIEEQHTIRRNKKKIYFGENIIFDRRKGSI